VTPTEPFDGPDGLGVSHGAAETYRLANRWIVPQQVTVLAYDPEDPEWEWPQWLELDGNNMLPFTLTLPCVGLGCGKSPSIDLEVDGTGLDPGTYRGTILFSADDSGDPPFPIEREVYFDHCREVFVDTTLPEEIELGPGHEREQPLLVSPMGGTLVKDVDMIVQLGDSFGGVGTDRPFEIWLKSPGGDYVPLKEEGHLFQTVYDDSTSPPPAEPMSNFIDDSSPGTWKLKIVNKGTGTWTFDLTRFEIRLHHQLAQPCV
jgi:hypothetical protein